MTEKVVKTDAEWQAQLSPEAYKVTRKHGTERAFTGEYHDFKGEGIYKCVCCGTPLFTSETKFNSGTGWPSYWQPVNDKNVTEKSDFSFFMDFFKARLLNEVEFENLDHVICVSMIDKKVYIKIHKLLC